MTDFADRTPAELWVNRDTSWLEFNRRVLALAGEPDRPLLERVKFLAIFSSNLDEFFMKRVGLLKRLISAGIDRRSRDGMTTPQQFDAIRQLIIELQTHQADIYENQIIPALREEGIELLHRADLDERESRAIDGWYTDNVFPILTPLAVDPGHRFPFISNLSVNLGIVLTQPGRHEQLFARVKIPNVLPGFVKVPGSGDHRYVHLDEVIAANLDSLFPGMEIEQAMAFRVIRNADVGRDEDAEDLLESVEAELRMRRFANVVCLETAPEPPPTILRFLLDELKLDDHDNYARQGPLEYGSLFQIAAIDRPDLKDKPWHPVVPARFAESEENIFTSIRASDILVHHPYESFNDSVERFIADAARDPDVLAIKQTLYRTSRDSPFIASLIRAAEDGKQVACLVELRARFDENRNVRFARQLEKAGVHVAYGVVGLKTHSKTSLVVRRESDGLRTYAHIGTGNYNPSTAQLYTDLGLLTANPQLTRDVINLFVTLTGRSTQQDYEQLLVAPYTMKNRFIEMIDGEIKFAKAGGRGRILAKNNALEDTGVMNKLYEASRAGVKITLFTRGFCCLRPQVPGLSDNIRVISVVGRFLEHSRIFHFGAGNDDPLQGHWYIGSGDWMHRNLHDRVEAACPVKDPSARAKLWRIFETMLADRCCAWEMNADGSYSKLQPATDADPDSPEVLGTFETIMRDTIHTKATEEVIR